MLSGFYRRMETAIDSRKGYDMIAIRFSRVTRLVVCALVIVAASAGLASLLTRPAGYNVVIVTVDALRADYTGPRPDNSLTPALDALAVESRQYTQAFTTYPSTSVALSSLLCGRTVAYPRYAGYPNLPGILRDAGYTTAAIVNNRCLVPGGLVEPGRGVERFFDFYDCGLPWREFTYDGLHANADPDDWPTVIRNLRRRTAAETTDLAIAWLRQRRSGPFFLWLHYFDTHDPYGPPAGSTESFPDTSAAGRFADASVIALDEDCPVEKLPDAEETRWLRKRYAAGVAYTDRQLARLWTELRSSGLLSRTILVVTADHGELLGEYGSWEHDRTPHYENSRVPLLIRIPASPPQRIDVPVSHLDLVPTILAALRRESPAGLPGQSLFASTPPPERGIVTLQERSVAMQQGEYRLFWYPNTGETRLTTTGTGTEQPVLRVQEEARRARMLTVLLRHFHQYQREMLDPDRRERLRSIGYIN